VDFLRTLLQEAAAVQLRAVRDMQPEFIQAQAAMTQQSLAVQQRALSQQEESLRVQQFSWLAQLTPILCGNCARGSAVSGIDRADGSFPALAT